MDDAQQPPQQQPSYQAALQGADGAAAGASAVDPRRQQQQQQQQQGGSAAATAAGNGQQVRRSKKARKNGPAGGSNGGAAGSAGTAAGAAGAGAPGEFVRVLPVPKRSDFLQEGWRPVRLSKYDKAAQMTVGEGQLQVTSAKGYRMARATHGVHEGCWYYEMEASRLGETGHCRVGWAKRKAELQAPVGYDAHSYGYRDLEGSKVHRAWREEYGEQYGEGDVIGCLLHLPHGGRPLEWDKEDLVKWKGQRGVWVVDKEGLQGEAKELPGSVLGFARNGAWQGVAYSALPEGTYYPAVSIFTLPEQRDGATLRVNFGPDFKYPLPNVDGCPPARPMCEASGPPPEGQHASVVHEAMPPPTIKMVGPAANPAAGPPI